MAASRRGVTIEKQRVSAPIGRRGFLQFVAAVGSVVWRVDGCCRAALASVAASKENPLRARIRLRMVARI
jgi:hypothetical protein